MRWLVLFAGILLTACDTGARFEQGQVWRLKPEFSTEAKVVIEKVGKRGKDQVVHFRVVDFSAHPRTAEAFARMNMFFPHEPRPEDLGGPSTFLISGMGSFRDWYGGSVVIDAGPNPPEGPVSIPHVALRADDLSAAVSTPLREDRDPSAWFESEYKLWMAGETSWPELNTRDLDRPLSATLANARKQADDKIEAWLIPVPPFAPDTAETKLADPAFAEDCRGWLKVILDQQGREFGASQLTRSQKFGPVWRADTGTSGSQPGVRVDRVLCWLPPGSGEPKMAFGWSLPPLSAN